MTRILDDYLLELKTKLLPLPYRDQDSVMAEVKAHLESDMAERAVRRPSLSREELELEATAAFGDADEITVAYGKEGGLVRKSTGEVLLRAAVLSGRVAKATGKAAGRGAKQVLKWSAITALILFVTAVVVGTTLLVTYKDTITHTARTYIPDHEVYHYAGGWAQTDPQNGPRSDTFQVTSLASRMDLDISTNPGSGCLAIQLTAPDGSIAYQNGQGCAGAHQKLSFTAAGTWKIQYTFVAYTGSVAVQGFEYHSR